MKESCDLEDFASLLERACMLIYIIVWIWFHVSWLIFAKETMLNVIFKRYIFLIEAKVFDVFEEVDVAFTRLSSIKKISLLLIESIVCWKRGIASQKTTQLVAYFAN